MFDLFYDDFASLTTGGEVTPAWSPDGKTLAFVDGPADERRGWLVDVATGDKSRLVDVGRVRAAITEATGETPPGRGLPFAQVVFTGPRSVEAQVGPHTVTVDLDTAGVSRKPDESLIDTVFGLSDSARRSPREYWRTQPLVDPAKALESGSPDGRFLASTRDGNIMLRSAYDGREFALTTDGTPEHEWRFDMSNPALALIGLLAPVTDWSPDSTKLAAYKVDNAGVSRKAQVHQLKRDDEVVHRYHATAGGVLERYTLHILDVHGRPAVDIDLGDTTDTYPMFAGWLPGGSEVLVVRISRDCRRADVLAADATTGAVRELFSETGDTFVRIHHDFYFGRKVGLLLTPDGEQILWLSERDGFKHLYAYDLQGTLLRQLTSGEWPVDAVQRVADGQVYFTARHDQDRPYDLHLCQVPLDGGEVRRLTEGEGVHSAAFSPAGDVFVDTYSTPDEPPAAVLRRMDGSALVELSWADTSKLDEAGWTAPQEFTVTAADGETELWGTMFFPHDFDPDRRYPLIDYVYGGPQLAVGPHSWSGTFARYARAIAQLGYITVVLDSRGTPERSKAFHDVVHRNFAGGHVDDHAAAMRQLADRHPFVDGERVGVTGHSWGGYAAFRLLADRPDVYRAAVSSAPGFDPFSSVLYECYLGLPQDHPEAYAAADTLPLAANLDGAFMLVCGTCDHATWTDAVKLSEALIRADKDHEFVVLPEQGHGYASSHDSYFWRKVAGFFEAQLGTPEG
ncbi:alpha/beta fold hydrolase [Streptomyces sp. YIM 130001]|uniref:alpha/beta fold hydrolase n=1 Tax=Streptomyces sp. YIM 130001 TaxID=2259644 RepID=UPI001968A9F3|nr:alpha/beta fold hydrolase [Streptomyces sp. YIM 130001]